MLFSVSSLCWGFIFLFLLNIFWCFKLCFRGSYCSGGGVVPTRSVISELRREMSRLPGRHVQRWDRGSEAAVHPRAERNLHPHHAQRGPAGHGAGRVGGIRAGKRSGITNPSDVFVSDFSPSVHRTRLETSEKLSMNYCVTPTSPLKSASSWLCWSCSRTWTSIPPTVTLSGSKSLQPSV